MAVAWLGQCAIDIYHSFLTRTYLPKYLFTFSLSIYYSPSLSQLVSPSLDPPRPLLTSPCVPVAAVLSRRLLRATLRISQLSNCDTRRSIVGFNAHTLISPLPSRHRYLTAFLSFDTIRTYVHGSHFSLIEFLSKTRPSIRPSEPTKRTILYDKNKLLLLFSKFKGSIYDTSFLSDRRINR